MRAPPPNPGTTADPAGLDDFCRALGARHRPNRRVLLIQVLQILLPSFNREVALRQGYYIFPPTGLQYLVAATQDMDLEFRILDMNYELLKRVHETPEFDPNDWLDILTATLESYDPGIVGVSCMFDLGIDAMLRILEHLRRENRRIVLTGGVIATYEAQTLLDRNLCHFVVKGEGENKFRLIMERLTGAHPTTPPVTGIHFLRNGEIVESAGATDRVTRIGNLIPTYALVPIERYHRYGSLNPFSRMASGNHPFATIQLNRGCRAACTFCSVRDFMGHGVRGRDHASLLEEMTHLIEHKGVRHFEWLDDDLLHDAEGFKELLREFIRRQWPITWSANNGLIAGSVDATLLELMRASGCVGFKIGVESGNAAMLRKVRKPASLGIFRRMAGLVRQTPEIFVGANFLFGVPGETFGQMMDSFRFNLELDLDWAAMTVCQKIRGASAFEEIGDFFEEQMASGGKGISNFIPSRESRDGSMPVAANVLRNLDIFRIPPATVPDDIQVKEIWLTFNLVANFICNKNLKPGGKVAKFIHWVEMARVAYPGNPYMCLFLALAHRIAGGDAQALGYHRMSRERLTTPYWQERFEAFGLTAIANALPATTDAAFQALDTLRQEVATHFDPRPDPQPSAGRTLCHA
ncbi:MAG: B12-binding domain-containing radical SAM protein [Magnetococcales bacterium]|nr:B12-binding domain-containing radical SAM protein [Magnetococcales bacterium]